MRALPRCGGWRVLFLVLLLPCVAAASEPQLHGHFEERDGQGYLFLWGTPSERGHAEGYLLASQIQDTFSDFILGGSLLPPPAWNAAIVNTVRNRVRVSPTTRERLKGMLRGIEERLTEEERVVPRLGRPLKEEDLLGALAISDFLGFFCSSFVVMGEMLEEGDGPLVGRNLDFPGSALLQKNTILRVEAEGEGTHAWVSIGWPGFAGCSTAISDQRISIAVHDVPTPKPRATHLMPRLAALADLIQTLDAGDDLAERAATMLREHDYAFGMNVMLGSQQGGAVLEVDTDRDQEDGVSVRATAVPFIVCTNHHRLRKEPSSCVRYGALDDGCRLVEGMQADLLTFESAWELLGAASVEATLHRCLIDLDSGRVRFQRRSEPQSDFLATVEFDLDKLFERLQQVRKVVDRSPRRSKR